MIEIYDKDAEIEDLKKKLHKARKKAKRWKKRCYQLEAILKRVDFNI